MLRRPEPPVRPNSRRGGGYSLRRSLVEQGVNDELQVDWHLQKVFSLLAQLPTLDITQYRVSKT